MRHPHLHWTCSDTTRLQTGDGRQAGRQAGSGHGHGQRAEQPEETGQAYQASMPRSMHPPTHPSIPPSLHTIHTIQYMPRYIYVHTYIYHDAGPWFTAACLAAVRLVVCVCVRPCACVRLCEGMCVRVRRVPVGAPVCATTTERENVVCMWCGVVWCAMRERECVCVWVCGRGCITTQRPTLLDDASTALARKKKSQAPCWLAYDLGARARVHDDAAARQLA